MTAWTLDDAFGVFIPIELCGSGSVLSLPDHFGPTEAVTWICFCFTLTAGRWPTWPNVTLQRTAVEREELTKPGMFLSGPLFWQT